MNAGRGWASCSQGVKRLHPPRQRPACSIRDGKQPVGVEECGGGANRKEMRENKGERPTPASCPLPVCLGEKGRGWHRGGARPLRWWSPPGCLWVTRFEMSFGASLGSDLACHCSFSFTQRVSEREPRLLRAQGAAAQRDRPPTDGGPPIRVPWPGLHQEGLRLLARLRGCSGPTPRPAGDGSSLALLLAHVLGLGGHRGDCLPQAPVLPEKLVEGDRKS